MDLFVPIDRTRPAPLRDQLYTGLRAAILDGRLAGGARLPASRVLARTLGISRFTVDDAYSRLVADGYVVGRHGSGTYVAYDAPAVDPAATPDTDGDVAPRGWSRWARDLGAPRLAYEAPPLRYSFKQGVPALEPFPLAAWRHCQVTVNHALRPELHGYGSVRGYGPLRETLAGYLGRARMLRCTPDQIVITTGTQQALDLLARLFLDPGDVVAVEEPGYPTAHRVFRAAGATLLPVPVDGDGLQVDRLDDVTGAKLLYVTPSHQFPTGGVLPLARRRALLAWARQRGTLIVEDDYDSEFRYGQRPVEALAALDGSFPGPGSVAYVGTFSKVLYPSLRLGYLVLPVDLVERVMAAKDVADRHPSTLDQATLAAFIDDGQFERHLARMRRVYASRLAALEAALTHWFGDRVVRDPAATAAGLHLLVQFDVPYGEAEMVARAAAAGVLVDPASPSYLVPPSRPGALLGYAVMDESGIDAGIRALAAVLLDEP
ncbi:MAG: PLP-dependent aminotransferase family protein [Thermomicrobiales bacterium]|nr:PLP-dependent aminotransferase family protein [Thermomicrobiales bacterium]